MSRTAAILHKTIQYFMTRGVQ